MSTVNRPPIALGGAAVLAGCAPPEPEYYDVWGGTGDDGADACEGGDFASDVVAAPGDEGTVPTVSFTTARPLAARLSFPGTDGRTLTTEWDAQGTTHRLFMLGAAPGEDVAFTLELDTGDAPCTAEGQVRVSDLPAAVPRVTVATLDSDRADRAPLAAPILTSPGGGTAWVTVIDPSGRVVFAIQPVHSMGYVSPAWRAGPARDGSGLRYLVQATSETDLAEVVRVALDGTVLDRVSVPGGHTDFVELGDGRVAVLSWDLREVGDDTVLGDRVLLVDEDGQSTELWNAFDHLSYDPDGGWSGGFYVPDPQALDWTHLNGISWDEASNHLVMTMAAYDGIVRVDVETGEQVWLAANGIGDFALADASGDALALPHSAQIVDDDTVLVFNRGDYQSRPDVCSWASTLELDHQSGTMATGEAWTSEDCLLVAFLGQADLRPSGHIDIGWSSAGRHDEISPDGEVVRQLELDLGAAFGFTTRM